MLSYSHIDIQTEGRGEKKKKKGKLYEVPIWNEMDFWTVVFGTVSKSLWVALCVSEP